jgi:DNA-binding SARP family transcriptional activator
MEVGDVGLLGPFRVIRNGKPLPLGGRRQRAVLAVLALSANSSVSRDRLIELVWGDDAPESAEGVLQTYIANLRKTLEPSGSPYKVLVSHAAGYELRLPRETIDIHRFEAEVRLGREALGGGDSARAVAVFSEALALWRGAALGEFANERFALTTARRLEELRLVAIEDRLEAQLALGRDQDLVPELESLAYEHPLRERLAALLMIALYRGGRQAEASNVYQRTRERLIDAAGLEPGPDLQQLLVRILRHDPALDASVPRTSITRSRTDDTGMAAQPLIRAGEKDYPLIAHEVIVGRRSTDGSATPDIDLSLLDRRRRISRRHALILNRSGSIYLRDLGSLNGTTCNGVNLSAGVDRLLESGDRIGFGGVETLYLSADDSTQRGTQTTNVAKGGASTKKKGRR